MLVFIMVFFNILILNLPMKNNLSLIELILDLEEVSEHLGVFLHLLLTFFGLVYLGLENIFLGCFLVRYSGLLTLVRKSLFLLYGKVSEINKIFTYKVHIS